MLKAGNLLVEVIRIRSLGIVTSTAGRIGQHRIAGDVTVGSLSHIWDGGGIAIRAVSNLTCCEGRNGIHARRRAAEDLAVRSHVELGVSTNRKRSSTNVGATGS
jgi:hypothetical protein